MRIGAALAASALLAICGGASAQEVRLNCNLGPIGRTFGGTSWVVYGCDDGKSVVVATHEGNPASPFMFVIAWEPHGYRVQGEGQGDRAASAAAFEELRALMTEQVATLHAATRQSRD